MANFGAIAPTLESLLATELAFARSNQGVWEWYNALQRCMSPSRVAGVVRVQGPESIGDTDYNNIETVADNRRVYGILVDNSNASENVWVTVADLTAANATPGTDLFNIAIWVPSATIVPVVYPNGLAFTVALSWYAGTGTAAGLEGGTGVTGTNPTGILVYTEAA